MRDSRIAHLLGGRGVMLRAWLVAEVGLAAAAVIDALDFLDRREEQGGMFVATRQRIIADLEGVVGRQRIDDALLRLVDLGWVERKEVTKPGLRNIQTTHHFSLAAEVINSWIFRRPENGTPGIPLPDPVSDPELERHLEVDVDVNAAASRARARGRDAAAAPDAGKRRRERSSGLVTWDADDVAEAERIEAKHDPSAVRVAVDAVVTAGRNPVPGLVAYKLTEVRRQAERQARQVDADAAHRQRVADASHVPLDPAATARALAAFPKLPGLRARRKTTLT